MAKSLAHMALEKHKRWVNKLVEKANGLDVSISSLGISGRHNATGVRRKVQPHFLVATNCSFFNNSTSWIPGTRNLHGPWYPSRQ